MCKAYLKAVQFCEFGELYLIGNSHPDYETTFDEALNSMIHMAKLENVEIITVEEFTRPTNVPLLISDCSKFTEVSSWKPLLSLEDIFKDTLDYWESNLQLEYNLNILGGVHPL